MVRRTWWMGAALAVAFLGGCAQMIAEMGKPNVEAMAIPAGDSVRYSGQTPLREAVSVGEVTGSEEVTSRFQMNLDAVVVSPIKLDEYRNALVSSLRTARLLGGPGPSAERYVLNARILRAERVRISFGVFGGNTQVAYRLVRVRDGAEVFGATVEAMSTEETGGTQGWPLVHGSLRKSISQLIERLYGVDLR